MDKEFVPYQPSLDLKELGFDEPCLFAWCNKGGWNKYEMIKEPIVQILKTDGNPFGQFFNGKNWNKEIIPNTKNSIQCSAPLYQQAFKWFREKYNLFGNILSIGERNYEWRIQNIKYLQDKRHFTLADIGGGEFDNTYEEAELECLKKLIEIVKEKL